MSWLDLIGRWLIAGGVILLVVGGIALLAARFLPSGGDLPGTIRIQGTGFTCIIPLLASIILSIVLTIVLNLLGRFLR